MMSKNAYSLNYEEDIISRCDVILTSDNELWVGIKYQPETFTDAPAVMFKYSEKFDYEFTKTVAIKGLPCFEQKLLTRDIFKKVNEGEAIPVEYISSIAKLYINLAISKKENKEIQKYCDVILFNRNIRLYDIEYNSIIAMLETNYKQTGIEYGYEPDFGAFRIYLSCDRHPQKMYQIISTYKEFSRHPNDLKKIIQTPEVINKNTFLCHEIKYRQKYFEQKFRLSNNDSVRELLWQ